MEHNCPDCAVGLTESKLLCVCWLFFYFFVESKHYFRWREIVLFCISSRINYELDSIQRLLKLLSSSMSRWIAVHRINSLHPSCMWGYTRRPRLQVSYTHFFHIRNWLHFASIINHSNRLGVKCRKKPMHYNKTSILIETP